MSNHHKVIYLFVRVSFLWITNFIWLRVLHGIRLLCLFLFNSEIIMYFTHLHRRLRDLLWCGNLRSNLTCQLQWLLYLWSDYPRREFCMATLNIHSLQLMFSHKLKLFIPQFWNFVINVKPNSNLYVLL